MLFYLKLFNANFAEFYLEIFNSGGEGGIRTHEGVLPLTRLAGERLRPLGHLSVKKQ